MAARHHLTILVPPGALREEVEGWRARWDPVMAAGVPAHVSVVYPEEVTDFDLLVARAEAATRDQVGFPLDARGVVGVDLSVWYLDEWEGEPANTAPEEHDAIAWCTARDWESRPLAHPDYRSLLADAVLG